MCVGHERQPIGRRLAPDLHADAGSAIARADSRLTLRIGAAVDRILDHPVDRGVVRTPPGRVAILALHRQIEIVFVEPE